MPEHAALITMLILERPMCLECLAAGTDMSIQRVRAYLERIGTMVTVKQHAIQRCRVCYSVTATVSIGRD